MVFTVPMKSRRAVLVTAVGAGAGLVVSGCWGRSAPVTPKPHPLAPALVGALALVDRYQATVATYPDLGERLQPLLADHQAHVEALRRAMGTPGPTASPSASASAAPSVATDPAAAVVALRTAEQAGQADATTACLAAAAEHAALLGSIAACRATHVEVLS